MRVALVYSAGSPLPQVVTDCAIPVFSIDERVPNDRVYEMGPGVDRVTPAEFDALIAGTVHRLGDKPNIEQAVLAKLHPGLALVDSGRCAGGVEIGVRACPKCGATEDDRCPYEKQ